MCYFCDMHTLPSKLQQMLKQRKEQDLFRKLSPPTDLIDFSSNDYLGFAKAEPGARTPGDRLAGGSTGSRLIRGNHSLYKEAEAVVAAFHKSDSALIYNSGYDANVGLLSSVPQRSDLVFYDQAAHASIRDGLRLSPARTYAFDHNNVLALQEKVRQVRENGIPEGAEIYVVTESVFSMEGDSPDLKSLAAYCQEQGFRLILDEAHAVGVLGPEGRGLAVKEDLQDVLFARVVTFGKALGSHGAAVLGSEDLRQFLINFSRSLIYTTALPPYSIKHLLHAYERLLGPEGTEARERLQSNLRLFQSSADSLGIGSIFPQVSAAIWSARVGSSADALQLSKVLSEEGFDLRAMRPPTVPKGSECLRFCLHSYNTEAEIQQVLTKLAGALKGMMHA